MRRARIRLAAGGLLLSLGVAAACVAGFRGKAAFSGEHDLTGVREVRISLPDTPIDVVACTPVEDDAAVCPETLSYRGIWDSVSGTARGAEDTASTPNLRLTREDGFAALSAIVPLSVAGLVDLEMGTLSLPADRDLQVFGGVGDVLVDGTRATVVVDVEVGDVEVRGGDEGLAVTTELGEVVVTTAGHADLRTGRGSVDIEQTGGAQDLLVETGDGDIIVTLADDGDVDFVIEAPGRISVNTPQVTSVTQGSFARRLGQGTVQITLRTDRGAVLVRGP